MTINFLLILMMVTTVCGLISLIDVLFWSRKRKKLVDTQQRLPFLIDNARALFPLLLIVLLFRSFLAQSFWVPSESLEPTLMPGDFLIVNQFTYGLRIPVWDKKIWSKGSPQRGDIVVFHWPVNPQIDLVKRVVGVPGDKVSYIDKVIYINGVAAQQRLISNEVVTDNTENKFTLKKYEENLSGKKHAIYLRSDRPTQNFYNLTVPDGMYFMMGDNRDDSDDSRFWGFMPEKNIIGKAEFVWMSWQHEQFAINWQRIGVML